VKDDTLVSWPDPRALWQKCVTSVKDRIDQPVWKAWLQEIVPLSVEGTTLLLGTEEFYRNLLNKDPQLRTMITGELRKALMTLTGQAFQLEWVPMENGRAEAPAFSASSSSLDAADDRDLDALINGPAEHPQSSNLNTLYTFSAFVEGASNQLAYAASRSVAKNPSRAYNPLFLYGGVGLGKTHLTQAIGNGILAQNSNARVMYVSTEVFMNEMIESISNKSAPAFRERYRNVDCLLVDDIQFLIGRERTQEEFFHTFNYLHANNRQIVLASDRPPHELHPLEDRLRSRFTQGLIADIQSPDVETREAILRKKVAEQFHVNVPLDVITFIAERFPNSIRDLEGAMTRVIAQASTHRRPIDMQLAGEALQQLLPPDRGKALTIRTIQDKVCEHFRIKSEDLVGTRRDARFALPRQIAMFLAREMTTSSLKQIADDFNKKDHTTVIHAIRKIEDDMSDDASTRENVDTIRHRLEDYRA